MLRRFHPELAILIALAAVTHLWQLFRPEAIVFDEVYFKAFAGHYLDGHYFFDIHPPLGKLILAGWAHLLSITGVQLASTPAVELRLVPAVFGIVLIPLIWGIAKELGASRRAAFLAAFLVLADNALTVESRFILTDSMLLAFGFASVYVYLLSRRVKGFKYSVALATSALLAGASLSTKWTGLTALALVIGMWFFDNKNRLFRSSWWRHIAILVLAPSLLYVGLFYLHFRLLPFTGDGDAFMTTRFQSTLSGSAYYDKTAKMTFIDKFSELNVEMFRANQTLTASHPYGSHWYSWPLELRPIYYWQGTTTLEDHKQGNIYLLGNPVIWWGSAIAIVSGLMIWAIKRKALGRRRTTVITFLLLAYLINYLPFMAVTRVMFLYHYFFSFIYGLLLSVLLWSWLLERNLGSKRAIWAYNALIAVTALGFIYFSPLTYGWPLSPHDLAQHMWLSSWR